MPPFPAGEGQHRQQQQRRQPAAVVPHQVWTVAIDPTGQHRQCVVPALQHTQPEHQAEVRQGQEQQRFAQAFVQLGQRLAPGVVGAIAAEREWHHQGQQGHHGQCHQQGQALPPGQIPVGGATHGVERGAPPGRQAAQPAQQGRQAGMARADQAVHDSEHEQTGQRVAQRDVQRAPALSIGSQVGPQETQREQGVEHARRRIDDTAPRAAWGGRRCGAGRDGGSNGEHGVSFHGVNRTRRGGRGRSGRRVGAARRRRSGHARPRRGRPRIARRRARWAIARRWRRSGGACARTRPSG